MTERIKHTRDMDLKSMRAVCGAITHVAIKTFFAHVDIEIFVSYRAVTWTKVQETRVKNKLA